MSTENPYPPADEQPAGDTHPDEAPVDAPAGLQEAASADPGPDVDPAADPGSVAHETAPVGAGDVAMQTLADALSTGLVAPAKTYRVTGPHTVLGTPPGETFTAVIEPGQEAFLVEVGHIAIVDVDESTESANGADKDQ